METLNPTKHWWLLITRGLLYILIGVSLFLFAGTFTSLSAQLIGGLVIAAGICGSVYAFNNLRADRNYIWELLRSGFDIGFGIAFLVYSKGDIDGFLGILGFWAMMYAFLQAVQTMYLFLQAGVASTFNLSGKVLHFLNVALAGGLSYMLTLTPTGIDNSLTIVGLFPIALGIIIILLAIQQKRQAVLVSKTR